MCVQYIKSQDSVKLTFRNIEGVDSRQTEAMTRRIDRLTQVYIDAVLNSLPSIGQRGAALMLRDLGVPLETAVRVLTQPGMRRRSLGRRTLAAGPTSAAR